LSRYTKQQTNSNDKGVGQRRRRRGDEKNETHFGILLNIRRTPVYDRNKKSGRHKI